MVKENNATEYNNEIKCEVCGHITFADDYGNSDVCPNCGWMQCKENEFFDEHKGISYPMLVPLSRAREQYKSGQKFKATLDDFINGLKFYSEMYFDYRGQRYFVFTKGKTAGSDKYGVVLCRSKEWSKEYSDVDAFGNNADIEGRLLKNIWDEVENPRFLNCCED